MTSASPMVVPMTTAVALVRGGRPRGAPRRPRPSASRPASSRSSGRCGGPRRHQGGPGGASPSPRRRTRDRAARRSNERISRSPLLPSASARKNSVRPSPTGAHGADARDEHAPPRPRGRRGQRARRAGVVPGRRHGALNSPPGDGGASVTRDGIAYFLAPGLASKKTSRAFQPRLAVHLQGSDDRTPCRPSPLQPPDPRRQCRLRAVRRDGGCGGGRRRGHARRHALRNPCRLPPHARRGHPAPLRHTQRGFVFVQPDGA